MAIVWDRGHVYDTATGKAPIFGMDPVVQAPTVEEANKASTDFPKAQGVQAFPHLDKRIPTHFIQVIYGIPEEYRNFRRSLCWLLKSHGLQTLDSRRLNNRGGSAYYGPENPKMDEKLRELVAALERETGVSDFVKVYRPGYSELEASDIISTVTKNALLDVQESEKSLSEFQDAMLGITELKGPKGEERDLISTGYARLESARRTIAEADSMLVRFTGEPVLEAEGARLRIKLQQLQAWTEKIQVAYDRYVKAHPRAKASGQEGAA